MTGRTAKRLLEQYPGKIVLPTDTLAGDAFSAEANTRVVPTNGSRAVSAVPSPKFS